MNIYVSLEPMRDYAGFGYASLDLVMYPMNLCEIMRDLVMLVVVSVMFRLSLLFRLCFVCLCCFGYVLIFGYVIVLLYEEYYII